MKNYILLVGKGSEALISELKNQQFLVKVFDAPFEAYAYCVARIKAEEPLPYGILCQEDLQNEEAYALLKRFKGIPSLMRIPFIFFRDSALSVNKTKALQAGASDFYTGNFKAENIAFRLHYFNKKNTAELPAPLLQQTRANGAALEKSFDKFFIPRYSLAKRVFDVVSSILALVVLSPLLLLIAVAILLESEGPVLYISKRVGAGYRIFRFYKFRTMYVNADQQIDKLVHLNLYQQGGTAAFVKINNDPRTTRVGRFLRNSSLDELPQLLNVLLGDMSLVGNRPLPLYEAEKITKDQWSKRFLAPAGITGLWQVTKRGKKEMSAEERIALDAAYADRCSLWYDLKIVAQTVPALMQKENV